MQSGGSWIDLIIYATVIIMGTIVIVDRIKKYNKNESEKECEKIVEAYKKALEDQKNKITELKLKVDKINGNGNNPS